MSIPRTITINPALNGYIVSVGCQTVVFSDREVMIAELRGYLEDPVKKQAQFTANAIHRSMLEGATPQRPY